jgi:diguanylate cyclase (GGDEF)-like protein/PAS domain S-box-containing protein
MKTGWQFGIAALLFYATGWLAMSSALPPAYIGAIWAPAGIGVAAVLLWGYRFLPVIFLINALLYLKVFELATLVDSPQKLLAILSVSLNSVLRAWLGNILIRRFVQFPYSLVSLRNIGLFFVLAGPVAAFVPAGLTIFALYLTGLIPLPETSYFFLKAWIADCTGVVVFVPLFFIIFARNQRIWQERIITLGLPLVVFFLVSLALSLFVQHKNVARLQQVIAQHSQAIKYELQNNLNHYSAALQTYKDVVLINPTLSQNDFRALSLSSFKQHPNMLHLEWLQHADNLVHSKFSVFRQGYQPTYFKSLSHLADKLKLSTHGIALIRSNELLVYLPVVESAQMKGLIAGVFDLSQVTSAWSTQKQQHHINIKLYDSIDVAHEHAILQTPDTFPELDSLGLSALDTLTLADETWRLKVSPDATFLRNNYPFSVWQLFTEGAFLPGLMSLVLLMLTGRDESVDLQVSERTEALKRSNRKLISRDKQFQKLVQTQSVIVWRADPVSYRFVYVNDEAETILGYPVSQWRSEPDFWRQRLHPDDKDRVQAYCAEEIQPRNYDLEYRMIKANGEIVWLRDIFTKVIKDGVVSELYGLMMDITKQKLTEEEFRVAAITFESQQGIMITDRYGQIIRVNNAFTEITGFLAHEVIGKTPAMLKSGRHDPAFFKNLWYELTTVGKFEGEVWNRRKDGEIYPEWQIITAVENNGEITHYVSVFSDITQKKEAENKIHNLAFYDALTGLPNRRLLLDRFEQEIAIARRHKQFGAVIFLDLDHFKLLNDSQGHLVGDELLIQVAQRLSSVLREEDTPARLGGDEFVVLLHANSENLTLVSEHARTVAEKIRKQLNTPFMLNQYQHQISTSIGITLFPEGGENPDMILQQADTAMYRSKASGRNAISFFQPSMQEAADQRLKLEQDLRTAIEKEGFMLFYQSQVDRNGVILGAEVLIRWDHPGQGIISPADFISVAEESSLILDIGLWVLRTTCQQIKAWQDTGAKVPRLSVNVSSRQFRQQDFVEQIKNVLVTSRISPQLLSIELTESVMIIDMDDTVAKMKALKKLGVSIAVDDFGTGYSSLAYLKRLPLDVLKIDRGFVRDILTDVNDAVIVETIISMARHLKLRVIAEGVESEQQFEFLKKQGCLMFQGYHFSRPLSAARFAEKYLSQS